MKVTVALSLVIFTVSASPLEYQYLPLPYQYNPYLLTPQVPAWFAQYRQPLVKGIIVEPVPNPVVIQLESEFECPGDGLYPDEDAKSACKDYFVCVKQADETLKVRIRCLVKKD